MNKKRTAREIIHHLVRLDQHGQLFTERPCDDRHKVILSIEGRLVVEEACRLCLEQGEAPKCSVSGEDTRCDAIIISLNREELADILSTLDSLAP